MAGPLERLTVVEMTGIDGAPSRPPRAGNGQVVDAAVPRAGCLSRATEAAPA